MTGYRIVLSVVVFILLSFSTLTAEMYLWTDKNGVKHFSNISPSKETNTFRRLTEHKPESNQMTKKKSGIKYAQYKVIKVYDGDTFKAVGHDVQIKVRLIGIDTPETERKDVVGQPFSRKAKKYLKTLIINKTVNIKGYRIGRYNRQLAEVFFEGKNVNLELVKAGLAEVYKGEDVEGFDISPYTEAELEAKEAGKGIWSQGRNYISPRKWRLMHKDD